MTSNLSKKKIIFFFKNQKLSIYYKKLTILFLIFVNIVEGDSIEYNTYNNHGTVGLINMPTARFFDESVHGITLYDGSPDQKITLSSNPFDWMEASFFYTNIQNKRYCSVSYDPVCNQDYKDKGFNFKLRLKKEGIFPAIAIGMNDMAGTGYYSSEYIVGSYGIDKFDFHFGLGFGTFNDANSSIKNPLIYLSDSFSERPSELEDKGGQFQPSRYFSGKETTPFYGLSYAASNKLLFRVERDISGNESKVEYKVPTSDYSFGFDYAINNRLSVGLSYERGAYTSLKLIYKNNPISSVKKYKYKKAEIKKEDNKYTKLIKNLESNGIGVNKILETTSSIGLELTQYIHPDINLIEDIIRTSAQDAGINKNIKKDIRIADLKAVSEIDKNYEKNSNLIYERKKTKSFSTSNKIRFQPFLASRENFFKGALLYENDTQFILRDNLFFNTNIKYSLIDNFDDLKYPPVNTFPAQVRSDVKDYLKNMNSNNILIGRAQLDYHYTPANNHHLMFSSGIFEDMFLGYGFEYLYFKSNTNYAIGFEAFDVKKRDYKWKFGTLDYKNVTTSLNFYYRNYGSIPFDMKLSYGEYLAGDFGSTLEFSRSFQNGTKFGIFASFTDVTSEQFGEGSFDKGIFFNIPIYGNFINYTWRPLTKDPGAKLNRNYSLYDLLVKFRPINW